MAERRIRWVLSVGTALLCLGWGVARAGQDVQIGDARLQWSGYLRQYLSVNLEDQPDRLADGSTLGGQGEISMARTSLLLKGSLDFGAFRIFSIGRWSREAETDYLDDLSDSSGVDLVDDVYDENELRELFVEFGLGERWNFRLGKQQVVWGETDFFQAGDIIHGFDQTWRSFFEPENEEWRKPLIMANVEIAIPELDGSLQLIYRPGWDDDDDLGNSLDVFGGRWAAQGSRGASTLALFPYNYKHNRGDSDDASYGFRWSGFGFDLAYSIYYYHTLNQEQVLNFIANPYGDAPLNGFGEFIFPQIDIIGGTATGYISAIDSVWRAEVAYTLDKPYNYGFAGTPFAGTAGVIEEDTARLMLGLDMALRQFGDGTSSPWQLSFQLFDSWIPGFDGSDGIIDIVTAKKKEHSITATVLLAMNFKHDSISPSIAFLHDVSYGGGAFVPAIDYKPGDHWRLRLEADLFYKSGNTCSTNPATGAGLICTHAFGTLDNSDQLLARITYQF